MRNGISRFAGLARRNHSCTLALLAVVAFGVACNSVLDVDNPNNEPEAGLGEPVIVGSLTNGLGGSVTRALTALYSPYGAATDEFSWVGSREGYKIADDGNIGTTSNEFTDAAFPWVAEARYLADDYIGRIEEFQKAGVLLDSLQLARAYLYGAAIYTTIPDAFDDFVIASSRREFGDPVGETNMVTMYDRAISFLDKGLVIANAKSNAEFRRSLMGMRARAKFAKALWGKVNPIGQVNTASPLVNDAGADADAAAALGFMGTTDYVFRLTPAVGGNNGFPVVGNDLNNRLELRAGDYSRDLALCRDATCDKYMLPTAAGNRITGVKYKDPVANIVDPVLSTAVALCCIRGTLNNNGDFVPLTIVSAREMLLIRAEVALAKGDVPGFTGFINQLRAFNSLTPYAGTPAPIEMLKHERFVNLFNQARRLTDMYRFGIRSDRWSSTGDAVRKPGCFFPIPAIERNSNPKVTVQPLCQP